MIPRIPIAAARLLAAVAPAQGQSDAVNTGARVRTTPRTEAYSAAVPKPTLAAVRYGDHERQVLDVWKAESPTPAPLVATSRRRTSASARPTGSAA